MKYLFLKTIQYSAKQIIKLWILCMPLVFLLKILRLEDWNIFFALAVALIGLMSWTGSINLQIVPALMRRYSRSVNHFWLMLIGLQITNLFFNVACFFAFILILNINLQLEILSHLLPIDYFWLFLIGLTFSINRLGDIKVSIGNLIFTKSAIILLMQFLGLCIFIIFTTALFTYSRVLGYAFFEAALISIFLLTNNLVLNSLPRAVLKKSLCVGLGAVVLLVLVSQPFDIKKFQLSPSLQSELQGFFNIEKKWNFGDLEKVETPSQWAAWLNSAAVLSPEQLLKALDKLEAICPAIPTDIPAYITCYEKDPTERAAIIKISNSSSEADILNQLKSPNMYARLVGLFAARHLEKFSLELKAKLQEIYQTPGRLSSVAEKTLNNVKNEKPLVVNVRILAEQIESRKN